MTSAYWPLTGLRLRSGDLELRLPDAADLDALARLAERGVHDPATMPFMQPWTDAEPVVRALGTMQYHWSAWAAWKPDDWSLNLVTVAAGTVVGTQGIEAKDFRVVREVSTGSWLGTDHQGHGIGTRMRTAVLGLAFAGLGAHYATSEAFEHNPASLAVSRKLGYRPDGIGRHSVRGEPAQCRRLRLSRPDWEQQQAVSVAIEGLEPCLPMFGAATAGPER